MSFEAEHYKYNDTCSPPLLYNVGKIVIEYKSTYMVFLRSFFKDRGTILFYCFHFIFIYCHFNSDPTSHRCYQIEIKLRL
jgi:hypothetical protein